MERGTVSGAEIKTSIFNLIDWEIFHCYNYMLFARRTGWSHMSRVSNLTAGKLKTLRPNFYENSCRCILIRILLKFVPKGLIDNYPSLFQIMVWCRTKDKQLLEPIMAQYTDAYMRYSASMSWNILLPTKQYGVIKYEIGPHQLVSNACHHEW